MLTAAPEPGANPQSGLSDDPFRGEDLQSPAARAPRSSPVNRSAPGVDADATQADLEILAQLLEDGQCRRSRVR